MEENNGEMTTVIEHDLSTKIINIFMIQNARYIFENFYEIMINIDAFKYSTTDYKQFLTYQKFENVAINTDTTEKIRIKFEKKNTISLIDLINIITPFDRAEFHIIKANIFFLLGLKNVNQLHCYYNNLINQMYKDSVLHANFLI